MLSLDDQRWSTLGHAYGEAGDIPPLLRQLARTTSPSGNWEAEPWYGLWSSLCHQGDVYEASYAAVPHIVSVALNAPSPVDFGFFQLPAAIEIARATGRGPDVPADLAGAYETAIAQLTTCVGRHLNGEWDPAMLLSVAAALAVSKGLHREAEALLELDSDTIERIISLEDD